MTKLDFNKRPEADPGRVVTVRNSGVWSGNDAHPFETQAQIRERRRSERVKLAARSDKIRFDAMISKFGVQRAAELGVPKEFIDRKLKFDLVITKLRRGCGKSHISGIARAPDSFCICMAFGTGDFDRCSLRTGRCDCNRTDSQSNGCRQQRFQHGFAFRGNCSSS